jgi:hypothetical protein
MWLYPASLKTSRPKRHCYYGAGAPQMVTQEFKFETLTRAGRMARPSSPFYIEIGETFIVHILNGHLDE